MPLETFKASDSLTMGVELELQLVNTYDHDLSSSADDLLELLFRNPFQSTNPPQLAVNLTPDIPEQKSGRHPSTPPLSPRMPWILERTISFWMRES